MEPAEGAAPEAADAVIPILERMRTDLLLTIAVARMAPRAGIVAVQLIKGIQSVPYDTPLRRSEYPLFPDVVGVGNVVALGISRCATMASWPIH